MKFIAFSRSDIFPIENQKISLEGLEVSVNLHSCIMWKEQSMEKSGVRESDPF